MPRKDEDVKICSKVVKQLVAGIRAEVEECAGIRETSTLNLRKMPPKVNAFPGVLLLQKSLGIFSRTALLSFRLP